MTLMEIKTFQQNELGKQIALVVGTRPGIVMFAPIIKEMHARNIEPLIIHTGQHYSPNMDGDFFEDLNLPQPDYRIEGVAEKKTHGGQTAKMLEGIESVLMDRKPCLLLVGGDANTNLAGALAARKLQIRVGHVEAGERSFDWRMPEEHNRRIIDHISDYLFTTGKKGKKNLENERVQGKIFITGNTIVDASLQHLEIAKTKSDVLNRFKVSYRKYCIMTLHREENVDIKENLIGALNGVSKTHSDQNLPILVLAHPRTTKRLNEFGLTEWASNLNGISIVEAVPYLDFLNLVVNARMIFTDSGGVQQEAYIQKIPCITLRENTEWTETLDYEGNRLAGCDPEKIRLQALRALKATPQWNPIFGNGDAAIKIVDIIMNDLKD
jgi:UDP-N-acetylglucosamine 2-epimerase (non-hydrolysing)